MSPLVPVRSGLAAEMQARDQQRISNPPANLLNRIVYDAVTPKSGVEGTATGAASTAAAAVRFDMCATIFTALCVAPLLTCGTTCHDTTHTQASSTAEGPDGLRVTASCTPASPAPAAGVVGKLPAWYTPFSRDDTTLVFESRFESGNLRRAIQVYVVEGWQCKGAVVVGSWSSAEVTDLLPAFVATCVAVACSFPYEYDLILKPDINTSGHTQWYNSKHNDTC